MSDTFQEVGPKLDEITQKLDTLVSSIKEMTNEFTKFNENISSNLSKISTQITEYFKTLNETSQEDFEKSKKVLEDIEQNVDSQLHPPASNIADINNRLEQVFEILGVIVDPDNLQNNIIKINEFVKNLKAE